MAAPRPCSARAAISSQKRRRGAAQHRGRREQRDAGQQQAAAPDDVAQPADADDQGGGGEEVGEDDPLHLREGGGEGLGHARQADIGDAGAERGHQHGQGKAGQSPWHREGSCLGWATACRVLTSLSLRLMLESNLQLRRPAPGMAERAAVALHSCIRRHITTGLVLWSMHVAARSQPARHAGCPARGRQRRARCPAAAAQPLGHEPGAGAAARDDGRPAAGQGRARPRPDAAGDRAAGAGRRSSCRRRRPSFVRPTALDLARLVAHLHAADQRRSGRDDRAGPDRAARQGSPRRAAALRHQGGQGQRAATRRLGRPRDGRGRQGDGAGGARSWPCSRTASSASCARGTR